jgi:endonuclease YncB( thermonuclease family)
VSKPWTPPRHTAKLRPSRIRRDPLLVPAPEGADKKSEWRSIEWERRFAVIGIVAFALAITIVTLTFSAVTAGLDIGGGSSAQEQRFGSCKNEGGPNCVLDADTIRVAGEQVDIAGMVVPQIQGARCGAEEQRAARAIDRLTQLLNSGKVTSGGVLRAADGSWRRTVEVNGRDVAGAMIAAGVAREDGGSRNWCG